MRSVTIAYFFSLAFCGGRGGGQSGMLPLKQIHVNNKQKKKGEKTIRKRGERPHRRKEKKEERKLSMTLFHQKM